MGSFRRDESRISSIEREYVCENQYLEYNRVHYPQETTSHRQIDKNSTWIISQNKTIC